MRERERERERDTQTHRHTHTQTHTHTDTHTHTERFWHCMKQALGGHNDRCILYGSLWRKIKRCGYIFTI